MSKYLNIHTGEETSFDDPKRGIWYSAKCGYWTDDWSKLSETKPFAIPCCPCCSMVGMQTTAEDWFNGAKIFEDQGNKDYVQFLNENKESCNLQLSFINRYKNYKKWVNNKFYKQY